MVLCEELIGAVRNIKLRYWILLGDVALTLLFFLAFFIYFKFFFFETEGDLWEIFSYIFYAYLFLVQYVWILLIWMGVVIVGLIKKKKELILGGFYALLLSGALIGYAVISMQE